MKLPRFLTNDKAHKDAVAFMEAVAARPEIDYKWVSDYAKSLWEHRLKLFAVLDDKADGIIKYLGGGTGLFALGVLAKVDSSTAYIAWCTMPAVLLALCSIGLAMWSRRPRLSAGLPSVKNAIDYANNLPKESEALGAFLGQWNLACEDMRLVCARKAILVAVRPYASRELFRVRDLIVLSSGPPAVWLPHGRMRDCHQLPQVGREPDRERILGVRRPAPRKEK
jgi:hypothetical protein